jgi:glucose-6-phosphate isomerase
MSKVWKKLEKHAKENRDFNLRAAFQADPDRVSQFSAQACDLHFDFSKNLISEKTLRLLQELAIKQNVSAGVSKMFAGERINKTENRSVLHVALRMPANQGLIVDGVDVVSDVHAVLARMEKFALAVRERRFLGSTGVPITTVVNIGIGGSDLGPVMAFEALRGYSQRDIDIKFVSNVDGSDIAEALVGLDAASTLFIIASKTFTTSETMTNAKTAKSWLEAELGDSFNPAAHFAALSTNLELVQAFGVDAANVFGFWDWVGGRFSVESAIGLSLMIAIGPNRYREFLDGSHQMDNYLISEPVESNAIYTMALLSVWYRNFLDAQSVAVLPYENYLKRFPAYLQQMLMESNGKSVTESGAPVKWQTSPVYWGEPGTNGQHSFHQLLHQGTSLIPVDFIFGLNPIKRMGNHHELLISNVLAQSSVLAFGKTAAEVRADGTAEELVAHKVMPGNRPSTLVTYPKLTPSVLGQLIALYEHITLIQGLIWNVASFDQWGVELGKVVANQITPALSGGDTAHLDASTVAAIERFRAYKEQ